jgi:hypothetical protein
MTWSPPEFQIGTALEHIRLLDGVCDEGPQRMQMARQAIRYMSKNEAAVFG